MLIDTIRDLDRPLVADCSTAHKSCPPFNDGIWAKLNIRQINVSQLLQDSVWVLYVRNIRGDVTLAFRAMARVGRGGATKSVISQ